jgi:type II secretory pathway component PulJ
VKILGRRNYYFIDRSIGKEYGSGLMEILISVALLSLIGVAFLTALSTGFKSNTTAYDETSAASVAQPDGSAQNSELYRC